MVEQQVIDAPRPQRASMIKGLFPSLPERGKIKIGSKGRVRTSTRGKEFQPPQKLDHFLVTTLERGTDENFLRDEEVHARLGDKPTEIPIRLLYDDPTINFPTRYACYVGRSLWCSGDGEMAMRLGADGVPGPVSCPCPRKEPGYAKADKCKMNGVLSVLIDGAGGLGGVWKFRTTSYNSIVGILSSMAFIRSITGGVLANIPLRLIVRPKQAQAPDGTAVTIYVVGIEFSGDVTALQGSAHAIALDRATTHVRIATIEDEARKLLQLAPPNAVLPGDEPNEIIDEFYPEQAQHAMAHPAASAVADLDAFAPAPIADLVVDATLIELARAAADRGSVGFREFYFGLDDDQRLELRPDISSLKQRAVEAGRLRPIKVPAVLEGIDDLDAFGLKPIAEAASPAVEPDQDQPAIDPAPTDPSSPRGRSEAFWSQDELHVSNSGVPGVIEFEIKRYLAECRDQLDVNGIDLANGRLIEKLPRAIREDVQAAITRRRNELPMVRE